MSYPSLSESYFMDFAPAAPEWVCLSCEQEVFPEDGVVNCWRCLDYRNVVTGEQWEATTGESWH